MADEWYYIEGGSQRGPVSAASLVAMLDAEAIPPASLVWTPGASDWIPAETAFKPQPVMPVAGDVTAGKPADSAKPANRWLIAWQMVALALEVPGALLLFVVGRSAMISPLGVLLVSAVAIPASIFVIAIFWRKKWAAYGFLAAAAAQVVFWLYAGIRMLTIGSPFAVAVFFAFSVAYLVSGALLVGAVRMGGRAGWSAFS